MSIFTDLGREKNIYMYMYMYTHTHIVSNITLIQKNHVFHKEFKNEFFQKMSLKGNYRIIIARPYNPLKHFDC